MARIFYASHRVSVSANTSSLCDSNTNPLHADDMPISSLIQSVGVNAAHDYTQIFELGRFDIYENLEGLPTAEITIERYMNPRNIGAFWRYGGNSVANVGRALFNVNMAVRDQESCTPSTSGIVSAFNMSISNYVLTFSAEGPATESVTFIGDNIGWTSGSSSEAFYGLGQGNSSVDNATGKAIVDRSFVAAGWDKGVQSLTYTVNMDREDIVSLGYGGSTKLLNYPVTITLEIETIADPGTGQGDNNIWGVALAPAGGVTNAAAPVAVRGAGNTVINVTSDSGNVVNMGYAYYISTTYGGGDAGGGNATVTNTLESYNTFSIDPASYN